MCICLSEGGFANTLGYAGAVGARHTFWYQNVARQPAPGPNAMVLHVPVAPGTRPELLDTTACPNVLKDMKRAVTPVTRAAPQEEFLMGAVAIVEMGPYHIVIADDPTLIPEALAQVPAHKRPAIRPDLLAFYKAAFPGWAMLCCCFDGTNFESLPIAVVYTPRYPDSLFFPALDSHTGGPPDLVTWVSVDHVLCFGTDTPAPPDSRYTPPDSTAPTVTTSRQGFVPVHYTDDLPAAVRTLLPEQVIGDTLHGLLPNGDFFADRAAIEQGVLYIERSAPRVGEAPQA
jgi:hypothetical protein